jgi:hypothetical protein
MAAQKMGCGGSSAVFDLGLNRDHFAIVDHGDELGPRMIRPGFCRAFCDELLFLDATTISSISPILTCWKFGDFTVEVEAKAKEAAELKLKRELEVLCRLPEASF